MDKEVKVFKNFLLNLQIYGIYHKSIFDTTV
jgi:hypothetical protein